MVSSTLDVLFQIYGVGLINIVIILRKVIYSTLFHETVLRNIGKSRLLSPLIDHVPINIHNRLDTLKKREMYWMFRLNTINPRGLNESKELIL